jgi:hypothetical protein
MECVLFEVQAISKGRQLVREDGLFAWVSRGHPKTEIESEIIAARTKYSTKENVENRNR